MSADSHDSRQKYAIWLLILIAAVLVLSFVASQSVSKEQMRSMVDTARAYGDQWWAPLALIAIYVIVNMTGLPGTPFTLAAGAVWGWFEGGILVMIAIVVGTAVPYFLARRGLYQLTERIERRFSSAVERIRREGFTAILLLRLMRVLPYAVVSYAAGAARIRADHYFLGTILGTLPGVVIYTYLADSILEGLVSPRQAMIRIVIAGVLIAALVIGTRIAAKRMRSDWDDSQPPK